MRTDLATVAEEVRRARIGSGLSLRDVAAATGISHAALWEFERGGASGLRLEHVGAVSAVVGLDLRVRAYPGADAIGDAAQSRLLARLRQHLDPGLRWRTEVPIVLDHAGRAWDAVITGSTWVLPVEAETILADLQAVERRIELKRLDAGATHVLIVATDTRRNRAALRAAPAAFGGFARDRRRVLGALRSGRDPAADAVILL